MLTIWSVWATRASSYQSVASHNQYTTIQSQLSSHKLLHDCCRRWDHCCAQLYYRLTETAEHTIQPDIACTKAFLTSWESRTVDHYLHQHLHQHQYLHSFPKCQQRSQQSMKSIHLWVQSQQSTFITEQRVMIRKTIKHFKHGNVLISASPALNHRTLVINSSLLINTNGMCHKYNKTESLLKGNWQMGSDSEKF